MSQWVVVHSEHRPGIIGGTELLAIRNLRLAGLDVYWPHYRTEIAAHPRNGRKAIPIMKGYYAPWLFVAVDNPADDVARIRGTRYVGGVLWTEADPHYLPAWWLTWVGSGKERIDGETGEIVKPPACIDPVSGLFEPPDKVAERRRLAIGQQVKIAGADPFAGFMAQIEIDNGAAAKIWHDVLGRRVSRWIDPSQLEVQP